MSTIQKQCTCCKDCEFWTKTMDAMECGHPAFNGRPYTDRLIITGSDFHSETVPAKCPLRDGELTVTYSLKSQLYRFGDTTTEIIGDSEAFKRR